MSAALLFSPIRQALECLLKLTVGKMKSTFVADEGLRPITRPLVIFLIYPFIVSFGTLHKTKFLHPWVNYPVHTKVVGRS